MIINIFKKLTWLIIPLFLIACAHQVQYHEGKLQAPNDQLLKTVSDIQNQLDSNPKYQLKRYNIPIKKYKDLVGILIKQVNAHLISEPQAISIILKSFNFLKNDRFKELYKLSFDYVTIPRSPPDPIEVPEEPGPL